MTAIFEIFEHRDSVAVLLAEDALPLDEGQTVRIVPRRDKADRVEAGLRRLSAELPATAYKAWLSKEDGIEDSLCAFIRLGFKTKRDPSGMLYDAAVARVMAAERKVSSEARRYIQFVRFVSSGGGVYVADIEPGYDILELIAGHFTERFGDMRFIIRDRLRKKALVWDMKRWHISSLPTWQEPPLPGDGGFEELWRRYFKAVAIPARKNLKLQAQHVPHKYRKYMTEMKK